MSSAEARIGPQDVLDTAIGAREDGTEIRVGDYWTVEQAAAFLDEFKDVLSMTMLEVGTVFLELRIDEVANAPWEDLNER